LKKELKDFKQAIGSVHSDKFLSVEAFQELYNFYCTEILKGNSHINWIVKNERSKEVTKDMDKKGFSKKEQKVVKKGIEKGRRAKFSLGDMEVLQQLKNKLKDSE